MNNLLCMTLNFLKDFETRAFEIFREEDPDVDVEKFYRGRFCTPAQDLF